jgi:RNA polymerase primary sigma factor
MVATNNLAMATARAGLALYLRDIHRTKLLRPDEEKTLAREIQSGNMGARDRLVRANLRLVVSIARSYRRCGMDMEDLVEAGNLGLLAAADRFDPTRNVHFATYARFWIKLEIHNALSNTARTIRIPIYLVHLIRRYRRAAGELHEQTGRTPTHDEICTSLKFTRAQRRRLAEGLHFLRTPAFSDLGTDVELDRLFTDERTEAPESRATRAESVQQLGRMLGKIDRLEASVLQRRFGLLGAEPQTYRAISQDLGVGCKRVRRVEERGLRRLRMLLTRAG